ncbi:MAG TPA: hypothetical protein PLK82_11115 [Bacteroidales bacterium]|nr:hypothetical protein [Bacteroidales bacterium]
MMNDFFHKIKPSVSRHNLLLIAGMAWTTAGGILAWRGIDYLAGNDFIRFWHIAIDLAAGGIFYIILFAKISRKHIRRIKGLSIPYPCAFSFFNFRAYLMMAIMITGGILLRKSGIIEKRWLFNFFITMAVPLLISAARFYYYWATNKEIG